MNLCEYSRCTFLLIIEGLNAFWRLLLNFQVSILLPFDDSLILTSQLQSACQNLYKFGSKAILSTFKQFFIIFGEISIFHHWIPRGGEDRNFYLVRKLL